MNVGMDQQRPGPGVKRSDNTGLGSHVFFIAEQLKQRIARTGEKDLGHQPGIEMPQKPQFIGYGKYDMKMIAAQNSSLLFSKPFLNLKVSALRTYPMLTGVIPYTLIVTVRACLGVTAQNRSAAYHEAMSRFADKIR